MLALVLAKLCTLKASSEAARFYCPSLSGVEGSAGSWQPPSASPAKLAGAAGLHSLASLPEPCCVVRAGSCSPLQRAAQRTAAAAREHGQPAVPHRPFPPQKATTKIWAPAAPPASYPGPRETLQVQGCAREVLGSGRNQKSPGSPGVPRYAYTSISGELWDRQRTSAHVLQTQPEPAACPHRGEGSHGADRRPSPPGQHAFSSSFCTGILAVREGKPSPQAWSGTGAGAGGVAGSPAGDARSRPGTKQPELAGAAPRQSRDGSGASQPDSACASSIPTRTPAKAKDCPTAPANAFQGHTRPLASVNPKLASPRQVMRAPLSSCQLREEETERKCFQGQECPRGLGAGKNRCQGRPALGAGAPGHRDFRSHEVTLPQDSPLAQHWVCNAPQNVYF